MVLHVTCVLSVCYLVAICMLGGTGGSERRRITTPSAGGGPMKASRRNGLRSDPQEYVPTQALIEHNLSVMAAPVCERPTLTFATRGQDCVRNRSSTDGCSAALPERLSNHIGIRRSVHVQGDAVRYTHHGRWRSKAGQSVAYLLRNAGAGGSTWLTATSRLVSTRSLFQQVHPWWCVYIRTK